MKTPIMFDLSMEHQIERRRAKNYLYLLSFLLVGIQLLLLTEIEVLEIEGLYLITIMSCTYLLFLWQVGRGHLWAKWILSVNFLVSAILALLAGYEISSLQFKLAGIYYLFFGLILHFSNRLRPIFNSTVKYERNDTGKETPGIAVKLTATYEFPYLVDRYKAILIDGLILLSLMVVCLLVNRQLNFSPTWILVLNGTAVLLYEPVLTTYASTIGQWVMRIRVRNAEQPNEHINLKQAYIRFLIKAFLGWFSFIIINFNSEKRAIHDYTASSVMINI